MNQTPDKKVALMIAMLAAFFVPFMGSSVNIALPSIGKDFAMDAVALSWVATSFLLTAAMFLLPFGRLADIYGRKLFFFLGIVTYTLSSFASAISPSGFILILSRGLQGMGGAMIFSTGIAILSSVFPSNERGKALGMTAAAVYLGLSFGPPLGGLLTHYLGWRFVFLIHVPLGLIIIILILSKLKGEWADAKGESFDLLGSLTYCISLTALVYGLSLLPDNIGITIALIGLIGLFGFIVWEYNSPSPLLDVRIFQTSTVFAFSNLSTLIHYSATFAVGFLISLYLQYIKLYTPQIAGMILMVQPVVMALFSPSAGRLSDRIEPRIVASIGMVMTVIGLFVFSFISKDMTLSLIILNLTILGLGFALFSSPNTNAVMSSVDKKYFGVASATLGTMRLTGQMLSMGITTLIFSVKIGKVQITEEYYQQFLVSSRMAFLIFSILCFLGILASMARGKIR
ncbi:MAG: MFS transporter [Acidobacteriia bacterium]|jgi:EmrB/QacA subfamily drug resistance transporter|nr:MFS transporter [Terriglobia bacterium]